MLGIGGLDEMVIGALSAVWGSHGCSAQQRDRMSPTERVERLFCMNVERLRNIVSIDM